MTRRPLEDAVVADPPHARRRQSQRVPLYRRLRGLVIGENLRALRVAQVVVWLVAAGAGWWFFYRFFQQIEAGWRRDPTRRTRLLGGSVLSVLVLLTSAYLVAIRFEIPGWVFLIVIAVDRYFRLRRRESP